MSPDSDATAGLLERLAAGDPSAADRLAQAYLSLSSTAGVQGADELLDQLALLAGRGTAMAVNLLVALVHQHRLAERAVAQVLIDPADIDDALQLTLIAIVERVDRFEGRARFRTWLFRVARNEALMLLRRKARQPEPVGDAMPEPAGFVHRLSSVVAGRHSIEQLLARLPEHYREPLRLKEFEQLEYAEIAARLGLPIGTVRSRIARAREQLTREAWTW